MDRTTWLRPGRRRNSPDGPPVPVADGDPGGLAYPDPPGPARGPPPVLLGQRVVRAVLEEQLHEHRMHGILLRRGHGRGRSAHRAGGGRPRTAAGIRAVPGHWAAPRWRACSWPGTR